MNSNIFNDKKQLIVLEMANNHQGDLDHGKKIIDEFEKVCKKYKDNFNFAFKFQYRDIDNLIHNDFSNSDMKYIKRFRETKLSNDEWKNLLEYTTDKGFYKICTPFDEESVDRVIKDNFDILKIASAYIDDWPLLEKIVKKDIDIIASVGGADILKIKRFYSFMKNNGKNFALNYCVALYPTELADTNLAYLRKLMSMFPDISFGFSTHEIDKSSITGVIAHSIGANLHEKHVAIEDLEKGYTINDYSTTPENLDKWLKLLYESVEIIGSAENKEKHILPKEIASIRDLKRGVYAKNNISKDSKLVENDIYFAIPVQKNQILSNDLSKFNNITFIKDIKKDEPIFLDDVIIENQRVQIETIRDEFLESIKSNGIVLKPGLDLEISHHFGIEHFNETGCCMVTLFNKEYCKKIIYLKPGQENPEHYHKIKKESFILLDGDLNVILDNVSHDLNKGEIMHIGRGALHSFSSENGALFEEISTTHHSDDSFYTNKEIMNNKFRKSKIKLL
jgi:sialic acid synthase SpsE/quercetin dioxygenase-like cupin family protein